MIPCYSANDHCYLSIKVTIRLPQITLSEFLSDMQLDNMQQRTKKNDQGIDFLIYPFKIMNHIIVICNSPDT